MVGEEITPKREFRKISNGTVPQVGKSNKHASVIAADAKAGGKRSCPQYRIVGKV